MTPQEHAQLEDYLDGLLEGEALEAFERRLTVDAALRREVEAQARVDRALARLFEPTPIQELILPDWGGARERRHGTPFRRRPGRDRGDGGRLASSPRRQYFALAAAIAMLCLAAAALYFGLPSATPSSNYVVREGTVAEVYRKEVESGFEPAWVCRDDREFATTVWLQFREALIMPDVPAGVAALGWSYSNALSPDTMHMLARVDGEEVIVFVDRADRAREPMVPESAGLNLFRREAGGLVLYELTPLNEPRVMSLFKAIDLPEEWLPPRPGLEIDEG